MTTIRLNSQDDIKSKVSKNYTELHIIDISTDTDTSTHYVMGKITKKSALQKTKRFNYMKFCLQDASDPDSGISVFVTGDIAEDVDKLPENTLVLLNGFLVENNTRVNDGSHKYQLVIDPEISTPNVWYLPESKIKPQATSSNTNTQQNVQGRQLRSNNRQPITQKSVNQRDIQSTNKKQPLSFVTSRLENKKLDVNNGINQSSKSPVKNSGLAPVVSERCFNRKAEADSTTPEKSPNKLITLRNTANRQKQNLNQQPESTKRNDAQVKLSPNKHAPNRQSGSDQISIGAYKIKSPDKHASTTQSISSQQKTNDDASLLRVSPLKGDLGFQPVASTSTAGLGTSPNKTVAKNQSDTSNSAEQQKKSPTKTWSQKKYICAQTYKYQDLDAVRSNTMVDVYGVVKFCKPPYKTRGSDYCMIATLVDSTLYGEDKKLKCLLFNREKMKLPRVKVGDIVRFHRLKISTYCNERQGQSSPGFAWLVFSGKQGDSMDPLSISSTNYTFTDDDKKKIEEIRDWLDGQEELRDGDQGCCIEDLIPGLYFDLSCQVIATCVIEEGVFVLIRVWDGTKTIYPVRDFDTETENCIVNADQALLHRAKEFMYDVALYDDHAIKYRNIQPGQFIKLCNLHAAKFVNVETRQDLSALPTVELVIHRGTSFGRGIVFLSSDWPDVQTLKEKFDRVCPPRDEFEDSLNIDELSPLASGSERQKSCNISASKRRVSSSEDQEDCDNLTMSKKCKTDASPLNKSDKQSPSKRKSGFSNDIDNSRSKRRSRRSSDFNMSCDQPELEMTCDFLTQSNTQESLPRCMLETATVILNHPFIKKTKLQDVLRHEVPYKFRILAHVEDYFPKADTSSDFIKLYCPCCHYLQNPTDEASSNPGNKQLTVNSSRDNVRYYYCPKCEENQEKGEDTLADSPLPVLEYIYMMRFLLNDGSGWIIANIWKEEAVTFFKDIEPVQAFTNKRLFNEIKDCLHQICPRGGEQKPWIECCVKSYSVQEGTGFQIFDTAVA